MTSEEQRIAIAEACGVADRFVIMKRGLYYRPKGNGYTNCVSEAWIVTEKEADLHVYPHDEPVTKHRAPLPDYLSDLNAMHEAEKVLTLQQLRQMTVEIHDIMTRDPQQDWIPVCHATAAQRAEAFLRTIGKWKE